MDTTEHRTEHRVDVSIPVRLRFQNGMPQVGQATNISRGGMYVKTTAAARDGLCVDVYMTARTDQGEHRALVPAMVVHSAGHGLGLIMREIDPRTATLLACFLEPGGCPNEA